jgi:formate C-acetyltransferase
VRRRAKALAAVLSEMDLYIGKGELLVGGISSRSKGAPIFPEYDVQWLERELRDDPIPLNKRPGEPFDIADEDRLFLLDELIPFWKGKTEMDYLKPILTEEMWNTIFGTKAFDISWLMVAGDGHTIPDYSKVLQTGFSGIINEAETALDGMDALHPGYPKKAEFIRAAITVCRGLIAFARRYASLACTMAEKCADEQRRVELRQIADTCARVPEYGARTFREALQSLLFAHLVVQIEGNGHSISIGRADQILYPYYEGDLKTGVLDQAQAFELLNCLWLKLGEVTKLRDWNNTKFFVGNPLFQNMTIGGQTPDGYDAVNDLSYLCLASTKRLKVSQPSLCARYFNGTSGHFLRCCAETIKTGIGMPAMFNDEAIIPSMLSIGYQYPDAVNYGITGCVEPSPHGMIGGRLGGCFCSLPKMFEMALHNGRDPETGFCYCPGSGDLSCMETYDEVWAALKTQMDYHLDLHVRADNIIDDLIAEVVPSPCLSSLIYDCIGRGLDVKAGGPKYDYTTSQELGIACVANGLTALKEVVFTQKLIGPTEVLHALDTNFEDETTNPTGPVIRGMLIKKAPKYGNDNQLVDTIAAKLTEYWSTEKQKRHNSRYGKGPIGGFFITSTATVSSNVPMGSFVGATPDGRKKGDPLSEGISAYRGTDLEGPTALINSVGKIPNYLVAGGQLLNVKINPAFLETSEGLSGLIALIRGMFSHKGFHIQFNVVSSETLKDALSHPENYRDLIVRVAGYSAYFTTLNPDVQQDIIARTEHALR